MIYYINESLALEYDHILVFERKSNVSGTWSVSFLRWKPGEAHNNKGLNNGGTVNQAIYYQVHSYAVNNDIGLCDTTFITWHILWFQIVPHFWS